MNCLIPDGKIFHGEEARGQGENRKTPHCWIFRIVHLAWTQERLSVIKYRCYLRPGSDLVSTAAAANRESEIWDGGWQHKISIENVLSEIESHRHCIDTSINNGSVNHWARGQEKVTEWIFEARIFETWRPNSETPGLQFKYWDPRSAIQISRLQPGLHIWTADLGSH